MSTTSTSTEHTAAELLLLEVCGDITDPAERVPFIEAHNEKASEDLERLTRSVTQGEWLALTRLLDLSRAQIGDDNNLTLLALAYIKEKREKGKASLKVLLDFTDEDLLAFHSIAVDPDAPDDDEDDDEDDTDGS